MSSSLHIITVWLLFAATAVSAASLECTRYVSLDGSDTADGSQTHPWATVQHAADSAVAGDVICVQPGAYEPTDDVLLTVSGTAAAPITFLGAGTDQVTVRAGIVLDQDVSHVRIEGMRLTDFDIWGVTVAGGNQHVELAGLQIEGGEAGIRLTVGDSGEQPAYGPVNTVIITDCSVTGAVYSAIDCTPGPCDRLSIRGVDVSDVGINAGFAGDGIAVERGHTVVVEECSVHDVGGDGIDLGSRDVGRDQPGIVVRHNRVGRTGTNGLKLWSGGRIDTNAVWDTGATALVTEGGTYQIVNNTLFSMSSYGYLVVLGSYDSPHDAAVTMFNNIIANDDPEMGGTLVYVTPHTDLCADHNLYFNPYRPVDVICHAGLDGEPCFSAEDISDGGWTTISGQGDKSLYADPAFLLTQARDLHLTAASPAVDAASSGWSSPLDLDGLPRDELPDIGAYELHGSQCVVGCDATVPASTTVGQPVSMNATASTSGCSGEPAYAWSFGNGHTASVPSPEHAWASAGTFDWTLTVTVDDAHCTCGGVITVTETGHDTTRLMVPAVVHGPGAYGTQWRTSLAVLATGPDSAAVTLTLLTDNDSFVEIVSLPAGGTIRWDDVPVDLFGRSARAEVRGAIHVTSDEPILVTARTYNLSQSGTQGQYMPTLTAADAVPPADRAYLPHLRRDNNFRTNIGFANHGSRGTTVRVRLHDAGGTEIGRLDNVVVPAGRWRQLDDVFVGTGAGFTDLGWASVEVTGDGPVWAYASIVDNRTGDATTVPLLRAPDRP